MIVLFIWLFYLDDCFIYFQWSDTFPKQQVTEQESLRFMKKLLAVAVSHIAYLRVIFPERAFGDRSLEGK